MPESSHSPRDESAPKISAERFLLILEEKDLVPAQPLAALRRQVAKSKTPVSAGQLAKVLIHRGLLTPVQAKHLLGSMAAAAVKPQVPKKPASPRPSRAKEEDDELGFAPLDDEPAGKARPQKKPDDTEEEIHLAPLDDEPLVAKRKSPVAPTPRPVAPTPGLVAPAPPSSAYPPATSSGRATAWPAGVDFSSPTLVEAPPSQGPPRANEPAAPSAPVPAGRGGSLLEGELARAAAGPLDGILTDPALAASAAEAGNPLLSPAPRRGLRGLLGRTRTTGRRNKAWDSPLILVGGGALLVLVVAAAALVWGLRRQSGDVLLEKANDDYKAGSYTQAIFKYEQFLTDSPRHGSAGLARIRRGLAQIRQNTEGTSDWPKALEVAQGVLPQIATEDEFTNEGRPELVSLLPDIAEGLANQARKHPDPAIVDQAQEALRLCEKYILKSEQRAERISRIEALLALSLHDIDQGRELEKGVAAIKAAVTKGDAKGAYGVRKTLLKQYPALADDEKLRQAVLEISQAQQAAVKWVAKPQPAQTADATTAVLSTVAVAQRTAKLSAPGAAGQVVYAYAGGATYGLDAASGKVLWRRVVGLDGNGRRVAPPPLPLSSKPSGDALLVDFARNEVIRVEAVTGRLHWRHAVGERFQAYPVVVGDRVLVATPSGRLLAIDAASGESPGYTQLPQSLPVAPAAAAAHGLAFQAADHSNLFVVGLSDGRCRQSVYLGHEPGSITTPPVVAAGYVLVGINGGARDSMLHVLAINAEKKDKPLSPVQKIQLKGHVDTPPLVAGRNVLVATDQGIVRLFELGGSDAKTPLRDVATALAPGGESLIRFPLLQADRFWIGGTDLTAYEIQITQSRAVPKWMGDQRSTFQQPLVSIGQTIFHVRRKNGLPGLVVAAVSTEKPETYWETTLAAPLATEPMVDEGGKITAVNTLGAVYRLDASQLAASAVLDQPAAVADPAMLRGPVAAVVRLGGGRLALCGGPGSQQWAVADLVGGQRLLPTWPLPAPLACPPAALATGLIAPTQIGQVFLLDPASGKKLCEPFQPRLESGVQVPWRTPAATGNNEVVLSDGQARLYRLGIKNEPVPHLAALAEAELTQPLVSPVAVVGQLACAVDAAGALNTFQLPDLSRGPRQQLFGRCAWGPKAISERIMLATDDGQLYCLGPDGKLLWQTALPYGPLAGAPLPMGNRYVLASASGMVWRIEAAGGKEVGKVEVGQPLGSGPVLLGDRLLVAGHDGSLLEVKQP